MPLRCCMVIFRTCMLKNTGTEYEVQVTANFPGQFLKLIFVTVCKSNHKYLGANPIKSWSLCLHFLSTGFVTCLDQHNVAKWSCLFWSCNWKFLQDFSLTTCRTFSTPSEPGWANLVEDERSCSIDTNQPSFAPLDHLAVDYRYSTNPSNISKSTA